MNKYFKNILLFRDITVRRFYLLFFLLGCISYMPTELYSQSKSSTVSERKNVVKGNVTDKETNEPLIGVSVAVKGTQTGTITDMNGNYTLTIPNNIQRENAKLIFSYLGYTTQEINIKSTGVLDVALREDNYALDEVVVVGYGVSKRSDLTGALSSVNSKTLTEANTTSFSEALQGRIAGVRVNSQSGEPGGSIDIEIRGVNSVHGATSPLYVIDGVPMDSYANEVATSSVGGSTTQNPLSIIAPGDIESMEILKDASATAIYGARGANGVVIITTKSGKLGSKIKFTLSSSYGISEITKKMNMLNAQEYVNYRHELSPTVTTWGVDTNGDGILDTAKDVSDYVSHNWQDELFRTGGIAKINFSFQGGKDKTIFSGSVGYLNQEALVDKNDYRAYNARFKLDAKASDKVDVGLSALWTRSLNKGLASSGGGAGYWAGIVQSIYTFRPILMIAEGEDESQEVSLSTMVYEATKETDYNRILGSGYLRYKILKNLSFKAVLGGNYSSSKLTEFYGSNTLWGRSVNGRATLNQVQTLSYNATGTLDYWKKFGKNYLLKVMLGTEINAYKYERLQIVNTDFEDQSTGAYDISKGSKLEKPTSNVYDINRLSFFGRINYDIRNRYLFTATLRADGSSNFGAGKRFGYFPSLAFAWRADQEKFIRNISSISNLKLRASYGVTGNDRITAYQSMATLGSVYYASNGNTIYGAAPLTSANPDLKWEATTQYNVGVDLGLFKNRISFTADVYYKKTTDMLLNSKLPSQAGFPEQWRNIGDMENKGLELTLNTVNIVTKDWEWNTSFNYYMNRNKILSLGGGEDIPVSIANGYIRDVGVVREGQPLGTAYGYIWDGIYQINDFTWQNDSDPNIPHSQRTYALKEGIPKIAGVTVKPGDFKYKDLNKEGDGEGVINADDRTIISNSNPKFAGGFSTELKYKNISLSMFFEGVYGNDIFNAFPGRVEAGQGESAFNLTRDYWYNRWTPENPSNRYASLTNSTDNLASSYYVEDGSYLRFKTLTLGYTLNRKALKFCKISSLRFYASIDNVYVWTKYTGLDPDVRSSTKLLPGYDRLAYPRARTYTFGFDLTF